MPAWVYVLKRGYCQALVLAYFSVLFWLHPAPPPPRKINHQNLQHKNQSVMIQASGVAFNWSGIASITRQSQ